MIALGGALGCKRNISRGGWNSRKAEAAATKSEKEAAEEAAEAIR